MRVRIFSCHHKLPERILSTPLFSSLVSNVEAPAGSGLLSDLQGVNIAADNDHSEMRQQYYVWKNLLGDYDHVGFEHYSRPFYIDPLPAQESQARWPEMWRMRHALMSNTFTWQNDIGTACYNECMDLRESLGEAETERVRAWIGRHDVITVRPMHMDIEALWMRHGFPEDWWAMMEALRANSYFRSHPMVFDPHLNSCAYLNMYIMRAEMFADYMAFWHETMQHIENSGLPRKGRLWGFQSERIFALYLNQKRMENPLLAVGEVPFLFWNRSLP